MRETYKIHDTTVESSDEPHPKKRARDVERAFEDVMGYDIDLVDRMSVPKHIDMYGRDDVGATLNLSRKIDKMVYQGFGFFSLAKELPDFFGESTGSANVTSQVLEKDLRIDEVVAILADNGQMKEAANKVYDARAGSDPPTMDILGYAMWKYALGWDAERVMRDSGDFAKGNTAQDEGGIDGWWRGEERQLKAGSEVPSKGRRSLMKKDIPHAAYLWDMEGGLRVADLEEYLEMKEELAEENNLPKTLLDKSDDRKKNGMPRPFRFTWW